MPKQKRKTTSTIPAKKTRPPILADRVSTEVVVQSLEKQAAPLIRKLKDFTIRSNDDYEHAAGLMKQLKTIGKEADRQLATITVPLKEIDRNARAIFRPFQTTVKQFEEQIKTGMLAWQDRLDAGKKKLEERFESGEIKKPSTYLNKSAELENDANVRRVWRVVEVDASKTPLSFLIPDLVAIERSLKAGGKVPGWAYEQQKTIAI